MCLLLAGWFTYLAQSGSVARSLRRRPRAAWHVEEGAVCPESEEPCSYECMLLLCAFTWCGVLLEAPQLHFMCHTTATGTACGHFGAATAGAVWMSVARGMLLFVVGHSVWWLGCKQHQLLPLGC